MNCSPVLTWSKWTCSIHHFLVREYHLNAASHHEIMLLHSQLYFAFFAVMSHWSNVAFPLSLTKSNQIVFSSLTLKLTTGMVVCENCHQPAVCEILWRGHLAPTNKTILKSIRLIFLFHSDAHLIISQLFFYHYVGKPKYTELFKCL